MVIYIALVQNTFAVIKALQHESKKLLIYGNGYDSANANTIRTN